MATPLSTPSDEFTRRSSGEQAALYIRRLIFDGELQPGSRVPQDEVAQALGISRIPVREALIALEREGWVTIVMHRGAFVTVLDEQAVRDHYELYGLVYGFAVERAVLRSGTELGPALKVILRELQQTDDPIEIGRLTLQFHGKVIDAAQSPRIRVVLRSMSALIPGNFFELVPGAVDSEKRGFAAIVRAVAKGDGERAAAEYARTMKAQGDRVVQVLKGRGLLDPPTDPTARPAAHGAADQSVDQAVALATDPRSPS
ncbi:MAG: GntR family transcriptional regulator [Acidimicrobiales bacterium]